MKEKTFEELIDQYSYRGNYINSEKVVGEESVLQLMQQVRESTIAECAILYVPDGNPESWLNKINTLPTNSIKIDL